MSTESIERIENLIRVVGNVPDDKYDQRRWGTPISGCGCAIFHATNDAYFVARRLALDYSSGDIFKQIGAYFDIEEARAEMLFGYHNHTRLEELAMLRVLLLEKMAQGITTQIEAVQKATAELELT